MFLWTPEDGFGFYQIGDIVENERPARAVSFDPQTFEVGTHPVTDYITNPQKRIYRVQLRSGREVLVTKDHNLFTLDEDGGVTRIPSEDAEGEHVMVPATLPESPTETTELDLLDLLDPAETTVYASDGLGAVDWGSVPDGSQQFYEEQDSAPMTALSRTETPEQVEISFKQSDTKVSRTLTLSPEFGWVLGFYIAEGCARRKQIQVSNTDEEYLDRFTDFFESRETGVYWRETDRITKVTVCSALWSKVFRELSGTNEEKTIPQQAFDWPRPVLEALLEGLLDGDGCRRESRDTLYTSYEELANRAAYLGTRLGMLTSVYSRERETYIPMSDVEWSGEMWAVDFSEDAHKRGQYVPTPSSLLRRYRNEADMRMQDAAEAMGYSSKSSISNVENNEYDTVKRATLERFRDAYADAGVDTSRLDQILDEDVRFDKVVAVEETDRVEQTYDLEVQPDGRTIENFLGGRGGVFLSNTAGLCDPGYQGQITLELSNLGAAPVALEPDMRISQLTFTELRSPAERPYGEERGSKYQGQSGPQASRIGGDREFGGDQ
ncbi:dCTP deaminase domain-containing protein [Halovenus salina]|uniref:LAGLIDADG family homing endonuclease n=1 Tax=Halovenus salina TaxID=1510225 RepID=A0ABD5W3L1_9EURY|nr:LAGLIDADG family homing endonuclease [Halovenus salina]